MSPDRLVIEALTVAALRISSSGRLSPSATAAMTIASPRYTDKQLARIMRMLANALDEEEED